MCIIDPALEAGLYLTLDEEKLWASGVQEDIISVVENLNKAICEDDKIEFLLIVHQHKSLLWLIGHEILTETCLNNAIECTEVVLKGETPLNIDLNIQAPDKMFLIDHAARSLNPSLIEMFLYYGARADALSDVEYYFSSSGLKLPLHLALCELRGRDFIRPWTSSDSIFKLLTALCLSYQKPFLEAVGLLAWTTNEKEVASALMEFARDGKIKCFAALLLVAHRKLSHPMETLLNSLLSFDDTDMVCQDKKSEISILLDVFVRIGDQLEAYVKDRKHGVSIQQTRKDVTCCLHEAGFALKHSDTDLTDCFRYPLTTYKRVQAIKKPEDIGMSHYGKSGYRWIYGKRRILGKAIDREKFGRKYLHYQIRVDAEAKDISSCASSGLSSLTGVFSPCTAGFLYQTRLPAKAMSRVCLANPHPLWNTPHKKLWLLLSSARGLLIRMTLK